MHSETHRILVVEDDPSYAPMLLKWLGRQGLEVLHAVTGRAGLALAESRRPDLILLDIHLPDIDGIKLHKALRHNPKTCDIPIILLTGLDMLDSVLESAAIGLRADPICRKSDKLDNLLQKIRQALRAPNQIRKGPLCVDLKTRQIGINGKAFAPLAVRRFDVLCALMRSDGPVSREKLLKEIWGGVHNDPKVVDMTIARLRRDLKGAKHVLIQTTRYGYELILKGAP